MPTGPLRHGSIEIGDSHLIGEVPCRERERVIPPIDAFHKIFADERTMWGVAVVTSGDRMMRRFLPGGEMIVHDVAVRAGIRIVTEVRRSVRIHECVTSGSDKGPRQNRDQENEKEPLSRLFSQRRVLGRTFHRLYVVANVGVDEMRSHTMGLVEVILREKFLSTESEAFPSKSQHTDQMTPTIDGRHFSSTATGSFNRSGST